jgi:hypothetical protein
VQRWAHGPERRIRVERDEEDDPNAPVPELPDAPGDDDAIAA